jgi:hypothetical protein
MALAITASTNLTPVVVAFSRGAASRIVDVDYVLIEQKRP